MCGIAGFSGNYPESLLERMSVSISHRGPDDMGIHYSRDNSIGMAHRRLSIIDLSESGKQPMWDSEKRALIVYNGEIYNYLELRSELREEGFTFRSESDTEVLLNLYIRHGPDMLQKLNGIYAFAIWDSEKRTLFLARDCLGVKPLYYHESDMGFIFSSELKAILQEPGVDRMLSPAAIHNHMTYLWCPAPRTILESVNKLELGHALLVKEGKVTRKWQFYDLPYDLEIDKLTQEEAIVEVRHHLEMAVRRQMISDVPVGAFLSGGLDSSSVVYFANKANEGQKLQCFTIGFNDDFSTHEGMVEDLPYAKRVAEYLDVDLHTIYVGPEMVDELETMIYHLDEPQADPAPINALFISRLAREKGIKVLLSGTGGDDIFSGYRRHQALLMEKYWQWLPKSYRKALRVVAEKLPKKNMKSRRFAKAFQFADLNGDERISSYFHWNTPNVLWGLYSDEFREDLKKVQYKEPLIESLESLPQNIPAINRMLYLEGKHFLADHNLNYIDKMGMAAGVEVRVPLLDIELIDLAARLPVQFKQRGRVGKWIFKKAMEPILPPQVIYRPKTGFGAPLRSWLQKELHPILEDVLSERSLRNRGLFDFEMVNILLENDKRGRIDGTYTIFSLICIELWCRIFLDNPMPGPSRIVH